MSWINSTNLWKIMAVLLLYAIYRFVALPITEYPFYFTPLCHSSARLTDGKNVAFRLLDEEGKPLDCKRIRIEEESLCVESPCPDFSVIRRLKSSKEGLIVVPKKIFDDLLVSYVDEQRTEHAESKEFLFHSEGSYNERIKYADIAHLKKGAEPLVLNLKKESEERCDHSSRSSYRRNYCDGH